MRLWQKSDSGVANGIFRCGLEQKCSEVKRWNWPVGLLPSTSYLVWCLQPWPAPAFGTGWVRSKPQAESCELTCTCTLSSPSSSCFLLEVLRQACFWGHSDCTEWSTVFASRFTFKNKCDHLCVCFSHFFEYCPEKCYGSVLKYMRWYRDWIFLELAWRLKLNPGTYFMIKNFCGFTSNLPMHK